MTGKLPVPVLMYHSVGRDVPEWAWSFLRVPESTFEDHLRCLASRGFTSADLASLQAHVSGEHLLPTRSFVLTFDDGYLDNWTVVEPLLRRYGFSATVYVNPDFVDPRPGVRRRSDDQAMPASGHEAADPGHFLGDPSRAAKRGEKAPEKEVGTGTSAAEALAHCIARDAHGGPQRPELAFMSWDELRACRRGGALDVQSHLMTHTWYPTGEDIVDFHHPGSHYYWLEWNMFPKEKPFYLDRGRQSQIPLGTPVYEHKKAAVAHRAFPPREEGIALIDFVERCGGQDFFARDSWRRTLFDFVARLRSGRNVSFARETAAQQRQRVRDELKASKDGLEEELRGRVDYMAWPGGAYDDKAMRDAKQVYRGVTLGSRDRFLQRNSPGDDPQVQARMGVPHVTDRDRIYYPKGAYLVDQLLEYQGSDRARTRRRIRKLLHLMMLRMRLLQPTSRMSAMD